MREDGGWARKGEERRDEEGRAGGGSRQKSDLETWI